MLAGRLAASLVAGAASAWLLDRLREHRRHKGTMSGQADPSKESGKDCITGPLAAQAVDIVAIAALGRAVSLGLQADAMPAGCLATALVHQQAEKAQEASLHAVPRDSDFDAREDPLLVWASPSLAEQRLPACSASSRRVAVNTGQQVPFETDLFKGTATIWIAGLEASPAKPFERRRASSIITIRGRFKRSLAFDDVYTGQEFTRPMVHLPPKWLVESVLFRVARAVSPSTQIGPLSKPSLLVPVVAAAHAIQVQPLGESGDITNPAEDMRAFSGHLAQASGEPWPAKQRMKYFSHSHNRSGQVFDTEKEWTFSFAQGLIDLSRYELRMIQRFDMTRYVDGQPLQFMMKDKASGKYLFRFEVWHRKLLAAIQAGAGL